MKVIVSKYLEDKFSNFKVTDSLEEVASLKGVTTLVFHSCIEDSFNAGVLVSKIYASGVSRYVYINENPDPGMLLVLSGLGCRIYRDESYLEDEEELLALLEACF